MKNSEHESSTCLTGANYRVRLPYVGKTKDDQENEWVKLVDLVGDAGKILHWENVFFWGMDSIGGRYHACRGCLSELYWDPIATAKRLSYVGFRPAFELLDPDAQALPDGALIEMDTLYMGGEPVDPKAEMEYTPGAKLTFAPGPYNVRGYKVGNAVIADHVLLRTISWDELNEQFQFEEIPKLTGANYRVRLPYVGKDENGQDNEWVKLLGLVGESKYTLHWNKVFSFGLEHGDGDTAGDRACRGFSSARFLVYSSDSFRIPYLGFRPAFELLAPDAQALPDGTLVEIDTLYMGGEPVDPKAEMEYTPGAKLTFAPGPYNVRGYKVGNAVIADRVILLNISWDELNEQFQFEEIPVVVKLTGTKYKVRLPYAGKSEDDINNEWDKLLDSVGESDDTLHWMKVFSWGMENENSCGMPACASRGYLSARYWGCHNASYQYPYLGFRPAFELLDPDAQALPDGSLIEMDTLYMGGEPVDPKAEMEYTPGAKLTFAPGPYNVTGYKVGNTVIADHVLLRTISWDDISRQFPLI